MARMLHADVSDRLAATTVDLDPVEALLDRTAAPRSHSNLVVSNATGQESGDVDLSASCAVVVDEYPLRVETGVSSTSSVASGG